MKKASKCQFDRLAIALVLLTILDVSSLCSAARLTKANGEVVSGELVGILVLQAEPAKSEDGAVTYLLCAGKHVSSIDQNGTQCDMKTRILLRVIENPLGQAQMAVLEDAGYEIGRIKDGDGQLFVVPNGTKAIAMKPAGNFDVGPFHLLGTLDLRNGLAILTSNVTVKTVTGNMHVSVSDVVTPLPVTRLQPDQRIVPLTSAKTVFVDATGDKSPSGAGGFLMKMATKKYVYADAESARRDLIDAMEKSNRWTLAASAEKADLVLSVDEVNDSSGRDIIDRLWVFKGGSTANRASVQPLWFARQEARLRSATKLFSALEDDLRAITELQTQRISALSPVDSVPERTTSQGPILSAIQETLLTTLPKGVGVKQPAIWSLFFGGDGRQAAYIARYQAGDHMREALVLGEQRGPEFSFLSGATLSPDGSRIAYLATPHESTAILYLIIGNRRDRVQIKEQTTDPSWMPVFSPDGKRLAYKAETSNGKHVIRVADVADIPVGSHTDDKFTQLVYVSGPEFDGVDSAVFSPDGSRIAYSAVDHKKWFLALDGKKGPEFDDAAYPTFSPDSKTIAYRAAREGKSFVVIGDQEGPPFDDVGPVTFSPDGTRIGYAAKERGEPLIVVGDEKRPTKHFAESVVFSADGKQVGYWSRESPPGNRGKAFLVVNDKPGPEFDQVGIPTFSDSGNLAAYWARDGENYRMIIGDRKSRQFDGVGLTRRFSPDGMLGFGVLDGQQLRWTLVDAKPTSELLR